MKHEDAEAVAIDICGVPGVTGTTTQAVLDATTTRILDVYRKGAEEMRERCAKHLIEAGESLLRTMRTSKDIGAATAGGVGGEWIKRAATAIAALPLTEDDAEEAAYHQQMRDMTEGPDEQAIDTTAPGPAGEAVPMRIIPQAPRQTGDEARTDGQ